jgi:hypothetical protein
VFTDATTSVSNPDSSDDKSLLIQLDKPMGRVTEIKVLFDYEMSKGSTSLGAGSNLFGLSNYTDGASDTIFVLDVANEVGSVASPTTGSDSFTIVNPSSFSGLIEIKSILVIEQLGIQYATTYAEINNLRVEVTSEADFDDEPEALEKIISDLTVYSGGVGLHTTFTGLLEITEIHYAHRDMLVRFAGLTTTEPTGWTALNTARSGWNIRWWALKPVELEKTLNKIAYEGCFIFRFKADGSPQYIFVPDSPTADKTLTKNDIKDFQVKPSNFSNLLTKMDISYEKHPAENRYLTSVSSVNSTARTNWAVDTKENIKQVKLDAYVAPAIPTSPSANPNDDFYTYYNNIFGDIKLIVSGTIVNPEFYNLEVGDIVDFSDMHPTKAYGEAWTGKNFMITSIGRTIGTLKFEGREI